MSALPTQTPDTARGGPKAPPGSVIELIHYIIEKFGMATFGLISLATVILCLVWGVRAVSPQITALQEVSKSNAQATQALGGIVSELRSMAEDANRVGPIAEKLLNRLESSIDRIDRISTRPNVSP